MEFSFIHGVNLRKFPRVCTTAARLAPVRNIDQLAPPYDHAHALTTNFPGTSLDSVTAHVSVIIARAAPCVTDGTPHFKAVWLYMLTTPVDDDRAHHAANSTQRNCAG